MTDRLKDVPKVQAFVYAPQFAKQIGLDRTESAVCQSGSYKNVIDSLNDLGGTIGQCAPACAENATEADHYLRSYESNSDNFARVEARWLENRAKLRDLLVKARCWRLISGWRSHRVADQTLCFTSGRWATRPLDGIKNCKWPDQRMADLGCRVQPPARHRSSGAAPWLPRSAVP